VRENGVYIYIMCFRNAVLNREGVTQRRIIGANGRTCSFFFWKMWCFEYFILSMSVDFMRVYVVDNENHVLTFF
jgi:hypothetical protein